MINILLFKQIPKCFRINYIAMPKSKNKPKENPIVIMPSKGTTNLVSPEPLKSKSQMKFQVLNTPIKSSNDLKEYRVLRLENGLTCCLVSDKTPIYNNDSDSDDDDSDDEEYETESEQSEEESELDSSDMSDDGDGGPRYKEPQHKMAAAALCVGVGSFSDPKDIQGMAHFLEHMVFMGSEKYPKENDFDSFITKKGGSNNASTDFEITTFQLECFEKHLFPSLDRFAQFFISPLMKRESMTREREAIDSEFLQAVPSDMYRKEQLLLNLAKKESPVNTFAWGNLKTLCDDIADDMLYDEVHKFRKRHYSAHRMTLAVQSRLELDDLQEFIIELFSQVPANNLPGDDFVNLYKNVYDTDEFTKIYYILAIRGLIQVDLTWILPSLLHKYRSKPHQYVSWMLGDEGKGSLLAYLRKRAWALDMSTGNDETGSENNSLYTSFTVTITLSYPGLQNLDRIIELVFSYIDMLKKLGPQKRIYDEIKSIEDTSFRFSVEDSPSDFVEELVENMQLYPSEHYLTGSELFFEYDPVGISEVLDHLIPSKMNVMVLSNIARREDIKFDHIEPWFGTQYGVEDFSNEAMDKWKKPELIEEFSIPQPNQFLTDDFTILPVLQNQPLYPVKVVGDGLGEMWFRQDQKFKLPLAYYYFNLINPTAFASAKSVATLDCMVNLLGILVNEEAYPAQAADLNYQFSTNDKGVVLKVTGYNQKLPVLIELLTKYLKNFNSYLSVDTFNAVKDTLQKNYYNNLLSRRLVKEMRLNILIDNYYPTIDRYNAIGSLTYEEMQEFSVNFIRNLYVKLLVQGNVTEEVAKQVFHDFISTIEALPISMDNYPKFRVGQVPNGETCCRYESFTKNDPNSVITNYYQSGQFSLLESVIIELITMIIEEPLFDTLRTKEQLGYEVSCSHRDTYGILGFTVTVHTQITKNTTNYVDKRIENFVEEVSALLKDMSDEDFSDFKKDFIKVKQCVDVRLKEEVGRNWSEIVEDDYFFDRIPREIKILETLQLENLQNWWDDHTSKDKFRKLSVQAVGSAVQEPQLDYTAVTAHPELKLVFLKDDGESDKFVENIEKFKKELYLHPVIVPKF